MKKFVLWLMTGIILFPLSSNGEILVKIGILDMEKLVEEYPDAKQLKSSWDFFLSRKYFLIDYYEKDLENLEKSLVGKNLSERSNIESKRVLLKKRIEEMKIKKKQDLNLLENSKGKELKLKIFRSIKDTRRKTGFGMILSSKEEFILYSEKRMNFNPMVLEDLMSPDNKK